MDIGPDLAATQPGRFRGLSRREVRRVIAATAIRSVGSVAVLLALYAVVPLDAGSKWDLLVRIVASLVLTALVLWWQLHGIERSRWPNLRAIEALSLSVTFMVTAFAGAYVSLSRHSPDSFNEHLDRIGALYFTLTTLATVGYGDINARTDEARIVVMIQMVFNVAIIGTSVRLILGAARREARRRGEA